MYAVAASLVDIESLDWQRFSKISKINGMFNASIAMASCTPIVLHIHGRQEFWRLPEFLLQLFNNDTCLFVAIQVREMYAYFCNM